MSKTLKSNLFFLCAAAIWGFAFVAQCDAADKINAFLLIFVRYILGAIVLLPLIFIFGKKDGRKNNDTPKTFLYGAICGTVLFTASTLQQLGINLQPNAGKAGFITGIYTVLVPIFCFIFFKRKTGLNVIIGAVFALIGLYLLSAADGLANISAADIVLFIGSVFWAFHIISIDKFVPFVDPIKLSAVQFFVCGIWGLIFTIFTSNLNFATAVGQIQSSVIPLLYMGICSSGIAYTCQVLGQRDADPTYSAIILSLESVFAAIGGMLFGTDGVMSIRSFFGCVAIFIGIVISQISFKNSNRQKNKTHS